MIEVAAVLLLTAAGMMGRHRWRVRRTYNLGDRDETPVYLRSVGRVLLWEAAEAALMLGGGALLFRSGVPLFVAFGAALAAFYFPRAFAGIALIALAADRLL